MPASPDLSTSLQEARATLSRVWGYDSFRTGQEEVLASLLEGRDVLAVMPTGSGKSICYQLPALLRPASPLLSRP